MFLCVFLLRDLVNLATVQKFRLILPDRHVAEIKSNLLMAHYGSECQQCLVASFFLSICFR